MTKAATMNKPKAAAKAAAKPSPKAPPKVDKRFAQFGDPFAPESGVFAGNVRAEGDLSELRESMREFGWIPHHPAIRDERGVVLVGHRRLLVAAELGIEPQIVTMKLGLGDTGDAQRLRLALASNLGGKPMTAPERAKIAQQLYKEREWSLQRIGEALGVSKMQAARDVRGRTDRNPGLRSPTAKALADPAPTIEQAAPVEQLAEAPVKATTTAPVAIVPAPEPDPMPDANPRLAALVDRQGRLGPYVADVLAGTMSHAAACEKAGVAVGKVLRQQSMEVKAVTDIALMVDRATNTAAALIALVDRLSPAERARFDQLYTPAA